MSNQERGLEGVQISRLAVKEDHRGWLAEILRGDQTKGSFGQIYVTTAHPGKKKGNHYHTRKTEWFCVIKGRGKLVLQDLETGKRMEILMGDGNLVTVRIPPGVAHTIANVGEDMMYLLAHISEQFSPQDPDTVPFELD
jgi:dTDP-4-dehydrorhamnose 3,5-epimerase-like enzyme